MSEHKRQAALREIANFARIRLAEVGLHTSHHEIIIAPEMREVQQTNERNLPWKEYEPTGMFTVTFAFRVMKA